MNLAAGSLEGFTTYNNDTDPREVRGLMETIDQLKTELDELSTKN